MRRNKPYRFDVVTLFPDVCLKYGQTSILGRAQKAGRIKIKAVNPRDFTTDAHHTVDAHPYGGGPGMVMMVKPIHAAIRSLKLGRGRAKTRILLMSARGKLFTQGDARRLANEYGRLVLISGRYEGVDERVAQKIADEQISIGEYVLSGGELPAMVVVDAVSRQLEGVLGKKESLEESKGAYPVYTKPEHYRAGRENWNVPPVLLSGHARKIGKWREEFGRSLGKAGFDTKT